MAKFIVSMTCTNYEQVEVDAEDELDAEDQALERMSDIYDDAFVDEIEEVE